MPIDFERLQSRLKKTVASYPSHMPEDDEGMNPNECFHKEMKSNHKFCLGCGMENTPGARRKDTARFWAEKKVNDDHGDYDNIHDYGLD